MIRDAFRNLYVPSATEHLPAHRMRSHPFFVPEPDCIAEIDRKIIGSILSNRLRKMVLRATVCPSAPSPCIPIFSVAESVVL